MNGLEKNDEKLVVVRVCHSMPSLSARSLSFGIEDMFGADDEDWAIYRKIVLSSTFLSSLSRADLFRTLQLYRQTKKKTLRSYRQSSKSFSHTTRHLGLNRHMLRSPPNDQRSCPPSGHNT